MSEKYIPESGTIIIKEYVDGKISGLAAVAKTGAADDITFKDGETFQEKLDNGKLKGQTGATGPAGPAGSAGPAGANGSTGSAGPAGRGISKTELQNDYTLKFTYTDGTISTTSSIRGATGPAGPQGSAGAAGPQGPQGAAGSTGPAGPQGAAGIGIGTITVTSDSTSTSPPTCTVSSSTSGSNKNFTLAFKGLKGATGSQGAAGSTGPTGPQGPAGPNILSTSTTTSGLSGLLKSSGNKVAQAVAGTDYTVPIIYKEGEVDTGNKWIDGKPIYRLIKYITANVPAIGANGGSWTLYPLFSDKIPENIIFSHVELKDDTTQSWAHNKIPYQSSWSYSLDYFISPGDNYKFAFVKGSRTSVGAATYNLRVTVFYTKSNTPIPVSDPGLPEGPEIFIESYPDIGIARADYYGMMAGIEIPEDIDSTTTQSSPSSIDGPIIGDEQTHSPHFELIKSYYKYNCWNATMIRDAIEKWITEDEASMILNESHI